MLQFHACLTHGMHILIFESSQLEGLHMWGLIVMIIKMIQGLRKRMEAQIENIQEMFNKDLKKN